MRVKMSAVSRNSANLRHYLYFVMISVLFSVGKCEVISLNANNLNTVLGSNELVFVNFYADWCRFSQILTPVFAETYTKVKEEFPQQGKVVFAKVDSDKENSIAADYHISKYPTLKMFRNGQVMKKEYRGQRSVDALSNFIREQLRDPVTRHTSLGSLDETDEKKRHIIGYFGGEDSEGLRNLGKVAATLKDDCQFHAAVGLVPGGEGANRVDTIMYRAPKTRSQDIAYNGPLEDHDALLQWITDRCMPLVREITFENAEELTEEGLPFLILFHNPDDTATVDKFSQAVSRELLSERNAVNFLTADGLKFTHPLHHLGKSASDLPVLAIDSFRHMYVFPYDTKNDIEKPGYLKQFVSDLHSGKLHREFHHGPDPSTTPYPTPPAPGSEGDDGKPTEQHIPHDPSDSDTPGQKQPTSPPESSFRKLAPSRNRYTILRDEL